MLQSSGLIKFSEIRSELGIGGQAPFLIGSAIAGEYVALSCSVPRPDLINPGKSSEWYSYDHSASCAGECVTATGAFASMEPCIGGTTDDYMGVSVSLDGNVDVDTQFAIDVTYTSIGASCSGTTSTSTLYVTVLAGTDFGTLNACSGGLYIPGGAQICSACISATDNPNVSIGAVAGCSGAVLCPGTPPPPPPTPPTPPPPPPTPPPPPPPTPSSYYYSSANATNACMGSSLLSSPTFYPGLDPFCDATSIEDSALIMEVSGATIWISDGTNVREALVDTPNASGTATFVGPCVSCSALP